MSRQRGLTWYLPGQPSFRLIRHPDNGIVRKVMKRLLFAGLVMNLILASTVIAETDTLKKANELELQGQFKKSAAVLDEAVKDTSVSPLEKKRLEFEKDRLERIKKDYPQTKDDLFAQLRKAVKGLTREEFDRWVTDGWFDSQIGREHV